MFSFDRNHYKNLLICYEQDFQELESSWGKQRNPNSFQQQLLKIKDELSFNEEIIKELEIPFEWDSISIKDLQNFCERENSIIKKVIAIFAWGGMNEKHFVSCLSGRKASKSKELNRYVFQMNNERIYANYKDLFILLQHIQDHNLSREDIFRLFLDLNLFCCKIAYFTKLMFFLSPKRNWCYILDQWTGRSVNLLLDNKENLIKMNVNSKYNKKYVNEKNDEQTYVKFCSVIEELSTKISKDLNIEFKPHNVEQLLFSRPGPQKLSWRKYVENFG